MTTVGVNGLNPPERDVGQLGTSTVGQLSVVK